MAAALPAGDIHAKTLNTILLLPSKEAAGKTTKEEFDNCRRWHQGTPGTSRTSAFVLCQLIQTHFSQNFYTFHAQYAKADLHQLEIVEQSGAGPFRKFIWGVFQKIISIEAGKQYHTLIHQDDSNGTTISVLIEAYLENWDVLNHEKNVPPKVAGGTHSVAAQANPAAGAGGARIGVAAAAAAHT